MSTAGKKSVLIVDDEREIAEIIAAAFMDTGGYEVITAHDGYEGYKLARARTFDLICTDFRMPRLSGLDLIIGLRSSAANRTTPIFVISGFTAEATEKCQQLDHVLFFEKPIMEDELLERAKVILEHHQAPRRGSVDPGLTEAFIGAAAHAFSTVCRVANIKPDSGQGASAGDEITGIVAMSGTFLRGFLSVSFPAATFENLSATLEPGLKVGDAGAPRFVDELVGIVFGHARNELLKREVSVEKLGQGVFLGPGHRLELGAELASVSQRFTSAAGPFTIRLAVDALPF